MSSDAYIDLQSGTRAQGPAEMRNLHLSTTSIVQEAANASAEALQEFLAALGDQVRHLVDAHLRQLLSELVANARNCPATRLAVSSHQTVN